MSPIQGIIKKSLITLAAISCLLAVPACNDKVVVGRPDPPPVRQVPAKVEEKAPPPKPKEETPAPKPEPPKPEAAKPEPPKPEAAKPEPPKPEAAKPPEKEAPKPQLVAQASKPEDKTSASAPMSSPAKPRSAPEGEKAAAPGPTSPYKLDLSFGGFGLGIGLLDTPVSVAVDEQENIYVVDQGNNRVQKFDRFGIFQFTWGRQGMGDGDFTEENTGGKLFLKMTGEFEFNKPVGMLLDTDDTRHLIRIHVVDSLNYRIQRFLLTQNAGDQFPDNPLDANDPTNVFIKMNKLGGVEHDTELRDKYKAENRQVILDPVYIKKANNVLLAPFVWGGLGFAQGKLNVPTYPAKDDSGFIYVADTENGRVEGFYLTPNTIDTDTTFFREWGNNINLPYGSGRLNYPTAVVFDNSEHGSFLVLDRLQDGGYNIQRFDRDGQFIKVFAVSGEKEGMFIQPVSMTINPFDNTVFVTDKGRKKVMVYNNKGDFLYAFGGEELADPRGILVLRNNYVYVTDAVKNMVYRYIPQ